MKQTLKISLLLALAVFSIAFADKKKEELQPITIGKSIVSPDGAAAASSPWLPRNLETATSQYKVVNMFNNGFVLIAGNNTVAPMAGNYKGFYSKDSGKTFTKFLFPNFQSSATSTSMRFVGIASWGDSVMINADYAGYLIRSTNYGVKWDTVSTSYGTGAFYDGIKFISKDTVIAYGDAVDSTLYIARSTNRGATWTRVTFSTKLSANLSTITSASAGPKAIASVGNTVWFGGYSNANNIPALFKSTDAGLTWTVTDIANLGAKLKYSIVNMSFKDANVGFGLATNSYTLSLHKTTDGGATWSDTINMPGITTVLNQQYAQVQYLPGTSNVFVTGFDGVGPASWKSTDDGATWTKLVTPLNTGAAASLGHLSFISPSIGFGVGTRQVLQYSPSVEVTFVVNTATVPDTLKGTSTVQMRGDGGGSGGLLDWSGASSVRFTNIGGDYWRAKVRFAPGASFPYKVYTHAQPNVNENSPASVRDNGWENNILGGGNRNMAVGQNDTTIAVQFVNGSSAEQNQFWRPYTETDSLEVTFRINMANQEDFNPATSSVGVNGSFQGWGTPSAFALKQETNHGNGGSVAYNGTNFWSGTFKLPLKKANTDTLSAPLTYEYKFVQFPNATPTNYKWESVNPNRSFQIKKGSADTTLYWKWWDDVGVKPPAGNDTAIASFRVDMGNAIATNGYTAGDTVQVRYGFANSASVVGVKNLAKQGLTNIYTAVDSTILGVKVDSAGTKPLFYQYYIVKNGQDFRESYYNFSWPSTADQTLAERRSLILTKKKGTAANLANAGADTSKDQTKANRWPFFRNTRKLTQNVNVTFTVNLQPAYWQVAKGDTLFGIQNTVNVTNKDSVYKWGVSINGPATGTWASWGPSLGTDPLRKMYDDGTNGDAVANDRIYTRKIQFYKDSLNNVVGQEFKFGIQGGDNEGGKGGFGNNHIENINDAAATATIASQFGSINPLYYNQWNFATGTKSVRIDDGITPTQFTLSQNYPNPFNPSTVINYSIPVNGLVTLKIYNVLGQQVATLVNEVQTVGNYKATFNATSLSSGVYFYKIEAGSFTSVKKMMFLK